MDCKNLPIHETHDTQAFCGSKHLIREIFCAFFMCSNQSPTPANKVIYTARSHAGNSRFMQHFTRHTFGMIYI